MGVSVCVRLSVLAGAFECVSASENLMESGAFKIWS